MESREVEVRRRMREKERGSEGGGREVCINRNK
jgi:hypothetical protein